MAYLGNKILFNNEKGTDEVLIQATYKMDDSQKDYVKWKESDAKDHILYGSIYMEYPGKANLQRKKVELWLPEQVRERTAKGHEDLIGVMKMLYNYITVIVTEPGKLTLKCLPYGH